MTGTTDTTWWAFYLRDHLSGATAGVNLFDRVASGHSDYEVRTQAARLGTQVRQDRDRLANIMMDLGVRRHSLTALAAVAGELLGRLKPNGALTTRSSGADVLELEAMIAAVQGKALLWDTLLVFAQNSPRLDTQQLQDLTDRAKHQHATLVGLHTRVVRNTPAP